MAIARLAVRLGRSFKLYTAHDALGAAGGLDFLTSLRVKISLLENDRLGVPIRLAMPVRSVTILLVVRGRVFLLTSALRRVGMGARDCDFGFPNS